MAVCNIGGTDGGDSATHVQYLKNAEGNVLQQHVTLYRREKIVSVEEFWFFER